MNWLKINFGRLDNGNPPTKEQKYKVTYYLSDGNIVENKSVKYFKFLDGEWKYLHHYNWNYSTKDARAIPVYMSQNHFKKKVLKEKSEEPIFTNGTIYPPSSIMKIDFEWLECELN